MIQNSFLCRLHTIIEMWDSCTLVAMVMQVLLLLPAMVGTLKVDPKGYILYCPCMGKTTRLFVIQL